MSETKKVELDLSELLTPHERIVKEYSFFFPEFKWHYIFLYVIVSVISYLMLGEVQASFLSLLFVIPLLIVYTKLVFRIKKYKLLITDQRIIKVTTYSNSALSTSSVECVALDNILTIKTRYSLTIKTVTTILLFCTIIFFVATLMFNVTLYSMSESFRNVTIAVHTQNFVILLTIITICVILLFFLQTYDIHLQILSGNAYPKYYSEINSYTNTIYSGCTELKLRFLPMNIFQRILFKWILPELLDSQQRKNAKDLVLSLNGIIRDLMKS